jgi:hypothetical protein
MSSLFDLPVELAGEDGLADLAGDRADRRR